MDIKLDDYKTNCVEYSFQIDAFEDSIRLSKNIAG